jgi:hypothetical protein
MMILKDSFETFVEYSKNKTIQKVVPKQWVWCMLLCLHPFHTFSYLKNGHMRWVNKKDLTQNKIKTFMYLHLTTYLPNLPTYLFIYLYK